MRISIDPKDRAYKGTMAQPQSFRVTLDGEPVKFCQTADSDEGMVKRIKMEATEPYNQLAIGKDGNVIVETVYGVVRINRIGEPVRIR